MGQMERVGVIVNPMSARGGTARRWPQIHEIIRSHFREYRHHFTEKPTQAISLTRELLKEGYELIIGVGGDGTLSEISNGFFDALGRAINPEASFGIVPSGTGSDLVRSLQIPRDFQRSVQQIKDSRIRTLDIGHCRFTARDQTRQSRYFINIADIGLGAEVIHRLDSIPLQQRGPFTYYSGLLYSLRRLRSHQLCIHTDNQKEPVTGAYIIAAVANGSVFGGGMKIAPKAKPDDGLLDLVLVREMGPWEVVANTARLYRGTIDGHPKVTTLRGGKISIQSETACPLELDGESLGYLPADFSIIPRGIRLRA